MHEPVGRQCATKWANCLPCPGCASSRRPSNRRAKNRLTTNDASQRPVTKGSKGMGISGKAMQCVGGDSWGTGERAGDGAAFVGRWLLPPLYTGRLDVCIV